MLLVGRVCLASDSAALTCDCQISLAGGAGVQLYPYTPIPCSAQLYVLEYYCSNLAIGQSGLAELAFRVPAVYINLATLVTARSLCESVVSLFQ